MRRAGDLWPRIASFDALMRAAHRAARGQRRSLAVARFLDRSEPECLALLRELDAGTWRPGRTSTFEIRDPKPRTITAVPFRDRVVHHALIAPLEPVFERRMIRDSYACRRGKGTHAALRRAQELVRGQAFALKLDVASFFPSLDHGVVRTTLARIIKDLRVLALCDAILGDRGVGLPIGSLTSQWFANLVLDRLDHHIKEDLRIRGYVRYMDDFVLLAQDKRRLHHAHREVAAYLRDRLGLQLKTRATRLAPVREGLPFLGWMIYRGTMRLRPANLRRYRWRLRLRRWQLEHGHIDGEAHRRAVASVLAHVSHGGTAGLRRRWFEGHSLEL